MKKPTKTNKRKGARFGAILFVVWIMLVGIILVALPSTPTNKLSYGASVPFTPVPAKPNLQLEWFLVPTGSPTSFDNTQPGKPTQPGQPNQPTQPVSQPKPTQPGSFMPIPKTTPDFSALRATPIPGVGPTAPKSNGQLCSVGNNSGKPVTGNSCYCADLTVTCKNGVGYGANGGIYPGPNPCGTSAAPGSGRYCVEKPVIYLYPTVPTLVDVQVITSGSVVVSDPLYPVGGWKNVLASPDGSLQYDGKPYSELFYETSVTSFGQPRQGITIPTSQLSQQLSSLLDQLGLVGHEKQEFLSFWLPRLNALHAPYVFFGILPPSAKAGIDTVKISPQPATQIAFIAYFKPVQHPAENTLQLPPVPQRHGFVSVEWGGVIGK